jgi:hypothetical protein
VTTDTTPILTALDGQVECYRRLAKLAEMQHEFVQQSQTEQLLDVLGRRQEVLDRIGAFERTIAPAKRDWPAYLGRLDSAERGRAESLLAETRRLLEQITAADRNDALVLQQRKLNLGRQIHQAQNAKVLNRSYAAAAYATRPGRMDVQR